MATGEDIRRFTFTNRAEDLLGFTTNIINYIVEQSEANQLAHFKLKIILTELLTNSIKHTGKGVTTIEVTLTDASIRLNKIDNGSPLTINTPAFNISWPLANQSLAKDVINIYGDDTFTLKGALNENHSIRFFIEEKQPDNYGENFKMNLLEHLGLLIIARAADEFCYSFKEDDGSNVFSIVIFTALR